MNTTGKILDRFLKDAGLSQAEMAAGVDASQGQVSKWLKDLNTPSPKTWKRIQSFAAKLGYDLPKLSMIDDVNRN